MPNYSSPEALFRAFRNCKAPLIDSREIEGGELFFAIGRKNAQGVHRGAAFAAQALEKGARMVVHNSPALAQEQNPAYIYVADAEEALRELARHWRKELAAQIPILAITGSNGKTTTRQLTAEALQAAGFSVFQTPRNWNNELGLPLSILRINPEQHQLALLELGANHLGETAFLCQLAQPSHALLTNCGKDHIGEYGSWEAAIAANAELYEYMAQEQKPVFVNAEDDLLLSLSQKLEKRLFYGVGSRLQAQCSKIAPLALHIQYLPQEGAALEHYQLQSQLVGSFWREATLSALCIAEYFGAPLAKAIRGIESFRPQSLRSEYREWQGHALLLDCYNANPSSMQALIAELPKLPQEQEKVLVLGEMLELGGFSLEEHRAIYQSLQNKGYWVFYYGQAWQGALPEQLPPQQGFFVEKNSLKQALQELLGRSSRAYVLLKGSRANALETLFEEP